MNRHRGFIALVALTCLAGACSGESDSSGDGSPAPTPTNRNPSVTSISVSPAFGVVQLSQLTLAATATDPDNDALTYQWSIGAQTLTGANQTIPIPGDGLQTVRLTVSDGRGGSATDSREFASGTMTGTWTLRNVSGSTTVMTLTQNANRFGGTVMTQTFPGFTDPSTGTITPEGAISVRVKSEGNFADYIWTGQMDTTGPMAGRRITGNFNSVGQNPFFRNTPYTATK
jgi:hypothetical protein